MTNLLIYIGLGALTAILLFSSGRLAWLILRADPVSFEQNRRRLKSEGAENFWARLKRVMTGTVPVPEDGARDYCVSAGLGMVKNAEGGMEWQERGQFSKEAVDETFRHS